MIYVAAMTCLRSWLMHFRPSNWVNLDARYTRLKKALRFSAYFPKFKLSFVTARVIRWTAVKRASKGWWNWCGVCKYFFVFQQWWARVPHDWKDTVQSECKFIYLGQRTLHYGPYFCIIKQIVRRCNEDSGDTNGNNRLQETIISFEIIIIATFFVRIVRGSIE